MNTDTPETDKLFDECLKDMLAITSYKKMTEFARKLERERNDWKGAGIKIAYELVDCGITSAGILDGVCAMKSELIQLRNVCDEMTTRMEPIDVEESGYLELPHVKGKL